MIIYAACKNVSPLAYRELMDMVSAVKDRGLVDGIDNISKTKIRSIFALLKNAQAILANNEINNSVRLYLGKGVFNFHDFRVKHDQFLQRCILKQAPFHPLMNSNEVLWPANQSSVLEEKIKECDKYLMSLEEFFQGGQFQSMRQANTPPENMSSAAAAQDTMKDPLNFPSGTQKNPGSDFFLPTTVTNASTAASSMGVGGSGVPLYETKPRMNTSGMNPRNTFDDNSRSYDNNYSAAGYTSREFVPNSNNTRQVATYDSQSFTNQPPAAHYSGSVDPSSTSSYSLSAVSSSQYYNTYGNTNVGGGGGNNNRYGNNTNNNNNMGNMNNNRNRFQQQQPYQQQQQRQYHQQQQQQQQAPQQQQQQRQYYHSSQSQSMLSQQPQNAGYQRNSGSANTLGRSNSLGDSSSYYSSELPQQQQLRGGESDFYSNYNPHPSQSLLSDEQLGLSSYSQFQSKDFPLSNQQLPQQQKLPLSAANPLLDSPIFSSSSAVNSNNNNNNNNKDYFSFEQSDFDTFN
jgi:hypothetical protein